MSAAFKGIRPLGDLLRLFIAPAIWFAHLGALYAAEALICAGPQRSHGDTMNWIVFLFTVAALMCLIILAVRALRPGDGVPPPSGQTSAWFRRTTLLLAVLSGSGVIWTSLPTAFLPVCSSAP